MQTPRAIAQKIMTDVCARHDMAVEHVMSLRRNPNYVEARSEIAWTIREQCNWSYPHIGRFLGRNHSTAIRLTRIHQAKLDAGAA